MTIAELLHLRRRDEAIAAQRKEWEKVYGVDGLRQHFREILQQIAAELKAECENEKVV